MKHAFSLASQLATKMLLLEKKTQSKYYDVQNKIDNARKVATAMRELTASFVTNKSKISVRGIVGFPVENSDDADESEAKLSTAGVLKDLNNGDSPLDEANAENSNTSLPPRASSYQAVREENISSKENATLRQVALRRKSHELIQLNEFWISEEALVFKYSLVSFR